MSNVFLTIRQGLSDFANKGPSSQSYGFFSSHVWMWESDHEESWMPKSWCFWTVVLEKTLESPLDCKEIQPVHPKGNQSWIFTGRTDAEAETPILWLPDEKSWLIRKDPDAGKDWRQDKKGATEDEKVGWHHQLDGHEFEQALGVGDEQGGLSLPLMRCGENGTLPLLSSLPQSPVQFTLSVVADSLRPLNLTCYCWGWPWSRDWSNICQVSPL